MKQIKKISDLQENDQILVPTRKKGYFWRDEIEDEGIFHFISSSVAPCRDLFDHERWKKNFTPFEFFYEPISFSEYYGLQESLLKNISFFSHSSIHVLQKAWLFFSQGGDTFSQAELLSSGRKYNKSRIFICKNYRVGTGVFYLVGEEWSDYESIFMNNTLKVKIPEIQFSSAVDMINIALESATIDSNEILIGYIEKNFGARIPNELLDVHVRTGSKITRNMNLDDFFGNK